MPANETFVLGVAEFIDYLNQTLEVAYPFVCIEGELSSFRVSKNRWVYFDLKDEAEGALLKCFSTVSALPGPLEDGMRVRVSGSPRLHALYNFSFQVQQIMPVGEGSLKKAADLLKHKLELEGLFDHARKRSLPSVPRHIALITAGRSAAYADFVKIANARWGGVTIDHYDVLVQGIESPKQIVRAIETANSASMLADVLVLIRGGGSAEDLAAFNDEMLVRSVASSRIPTVVAIGHEVDVSLAEMAADLRASTPSNAAELIFPDKQAEKRHIGALHQKLDDILSTFIDQKRIVLAETTDRLDDGLWQILRGSNERIRWCQQLLSSLDPKRPLAQGYALVRDVTGKTLRSIHDVQMGDRLRLELSDGNVDVEVKETI